MTTVNNQLTMDRPITLRLLFLVLGPALLVVGIALGILWSEVTANRQFAVDQRVRLWNELIKTQDELQGVDLDQARLEGSVAQMVISMNRLLDKLDDMIAGQSSPL